MSGIKVAIEGSKDRPYAIVVATPRDENGHIHTIVAPITHRPPDDLGASLEIPAAICRSLGFDQGRHWLRFDELNRFLWPGYDLRPRSGGGYDYGMPGFFACYGDKTARIEGFPLSRMND